MGESREEVKSQNVSGEGESNEQVRSLCLRAKEGDQTAFGQLWEMHHNEIRGYVRLSGRVVVNKDDLDDFLAFAYLEVQEHMRSYDPNRARFIAFACNWVKFLGRKYWRQAQIIPMKQVRPSSVPDDNTKLATAKIVRVDIDEEEWANIAGPDENDSRIVDRMRLEKWLKRIFDMDSPPHQLILLGYVRLLKCGPKEIVSRYWHFELKAMLRILSSCDVLFTEGAVPMYVFLAGLDKKMKQPLKEVITHPATREIYQNLLNRITGDLRLDEYGAQAHNETLEGYITASVSNVVRQIYEMRKEEKSSSMPDSAHADKDVAAGVVRKERR